jgi:UDP-N-acetylglucosamine 1-carboxyvinyltransferase
VVDGVKQLRRADHTVLPDRIVAGTYAIAAAITNGDLILDDFPYDHLLAMVDVLNQTGVHITRLNQGGDPRRCRVQVTSDRLLKPVMFTTQPYPGFPTDLQAQFMTLLCLADGNSIVTEKIYPERFMHVAELSRMGARLVRQGATVIVQGVSKLIGAPVMASDLRASASLVLAGLVAQGETVISRVYHLDRGYARMDDALNSLGANIERFNADARTESMAEAV